MKCLIRYILVFATLTIYTTNSAYGQGRIQRPHKSDQTISNHSNAVQQRLSTSDGYINSYGYIDLGLSSKTKWATCNLGSSSPTELGDFYSWGEITPKEHYTNDSYSLKNISLGDVSGNERYDAATNLMGKEWHIPTIKQWKELQAECIFTSVVINGVKGVIVVGPNGNNIFLPVSGKMNQHGHVEGSGAARDNLPFESSSKYAECIFWSSTDNNDVENTYRISFSTYFEHPNMTDSFFWKWEGFQIRPVSSLSK